MEGQAAPGYLAERVDVVREHLAALYAAAPQLPAEFARVMQELAREWQARPGAVLGLIAVFVALGFALETLYRRGIRFASPSAPYTSVGERLRAAALRFGRDFGAVAAFTVGSAVAFLAFDWPQRTREAVLAFLAAFIAVRLVLVASRALASPDDRELRLAPADDAAARLWHRRVVLFAAWLATGWVLTGWLSLLGMSAPAVRLVAYVLGLGLLAIAAEAVWRRSRIAVGALVVIWLLWAAGARGLFWLATLALLLPVALRLAQRSVDHALRPLGADSAQSRGMLAASLGRGLRALLIIGAAYLLMVAFSLDMDAIAASDSIGMRLARGALHALVIVLLADLAWLVTASLIDRKLAEDPGNARWRTLLPIARSTIAVVLIVMTVLMALSALGVQVGPLLASAGVIGIAVGFGAQTLVRDLFSKFFYLLDDAFRVGEYIQSGNYKGTVEHLGARSVRLRHHRGALYTIPYGQLGAVQNMSRDWVIDKLTVRLTFNADLDKAKKLIKQVGKELAADPELAPQIFEPLKMQGVEEFGDFGMLIRMKMKTRPGEQFVIRRRAFAMIKAAFDANGIHFAQPTVEVARGGGEARAAAALREVQARRAAQSQE